MAGFFKRPEAPVRLGRQKLASYREALATQKLIDMKLPANISFTRPFSEGSTREILTLNNDSSNIVAFKVKTTAPKLYCVRPNAGFIRPGQYRDVVIILQQMEQEPPIDFKCRDKFLIQTVEVAYDESELKLEDIKDAWGFADQHKMGPVNDQKLRVNFLPANAEDDSEKIEVSQPVAKDTHKSLTQSPEQPMEAPNAQELEEAKTLIKSLEKQVEELRKQNAESELRKRNNVNPKNDTDYSTPKPAQKIAVKTSAKTIQEQYAANEFTIQTVIIIAVIGFILGVIMY